MSAVQQSASAPAPPRPTLLFVLVLAIATSGLVYELGLAAVASYLLGDTVHQFSLVIGVYLSALGGGAYLSRFVQRRLALTFVDVELATALVGGLSAPALLALYGSVGVWSALFYATVCLVGVLVGLELPLLIRALEHQLELKELIAKALSFDYAGALLGSLAFSFVLVPKLGLSRGAVVSGLLNAVVGLISTWALAGLPDVTPRELSRARVRAIAVLLTLLGALAYADRATTLSDSAVHPGRVLHAEQSRYQHIVLTETATALELYLNGHLQFSSRDERRYHESLVHPALTLASQHRRVFIGGGGDGLAAREVLRWPNVESVALVDLDRAVTDLFRTDERLLALNQRALHDPKLRVYNEDASLYLRDTEQAFDVILLDFPDPTHYGVGKLYALELYRKLAARLTDGGVVAIQATSPLFSAAAYWCIVRTLEAAGLFVLPYHAFIPSFGDWGFVLASKRPLEPPKAIPLEGLSFLTPPVLASLFAFPPESAKIEARVNRFDNQALVEYYVSAWKRWD